MWNPFGSIEVISKAKNRAHHDDNQIFWFRLFSLHDETKLQPSALNYSR